MYEMLGFEIHLSMVVGMRMDVHTFLMQGLDGLILVYNPRDYEERNLETFYSSFANGNNLTKWQCLILGVGFGSSTIQDPGKRLEMHVHQKLNSSCVSLILR